VLRSGCSEFEIASLKDDSPLFYLLIYLWGLRRAGEIGFMEKYTWSDSSKRLFCIAKDIFFKELETEDFCAGVTEWVHFEGKKLIP
jgi:hypothetical protein